MISRFSFLMFIVYCSLNAQQTYVPDDNFEQALIDLGYDNVLDNYVLTNNISSIDSLSIGHINISDTSGIEDFISLKYLYFVNCNLTALNVNNLTHLESLNLYKNILSEIDLSNNQLLKNLIVADNNLSQLDLTNNLLLEYLFIGSNNLSEIDVSQLDNLESLYISENPINEIDISNNNLLEVFGISHSPISQIDLSQNPNLKVLDISDINPTPVFSIINNQLIEELVVRYGNLSEIDISHLENLKFLSLDNNSLTELDVSNNPLLETFYASDNFLTEIDLSNNYNLLYLGLDGNNLTEINFDNNPVLADINLSNNQLTYLDLSQLPNLFFSKVSSNNLNYFNIQNGNNENISTYFFDARFNDLNCIQVDDPNWSNANWIYKDNETIYSADCENLSTNENLNQLKIYPNPVENILTIEYLAFKIDKINLIDVNGKTVFTKSLNSNPIQLDLKSYPKGIYFLQLVSGEKIIQTEKIIKK